MHSPFGSQPDLSTGFRCRFALPSADETKSIIYMTGYPSNKIMRFYFQYWSIEVFFEADLRDQRDHIDKFGLNSLYLVVPVSNEGMIKVFSVNSPWDWTRQIDTQFTGGITNIANFAYTPESDFFLVQSVTNKLFLYDFGSSGPTFIREYPATLRNSKNLVYIKGTNYFVSNDNSDAKIIDVRTG